MTEGNPRARNKGHLYAEQEILRLFGTNEPRGNPNGDRTLSAGRNTAQTC